MSRRIWDCFLFGDELDLLEHRLAELEDVVDVFVIAEADRTFTGLHKPLHYLENKERFARWSDQIVHAPARPRGDFVSPWQREAFQRRAMREAIRGAAPADLVIVGDVDEVPDPQALTYLRERVEEPVRLGMAHAIYWANWYMPAMWDEGPMMASASRVDDLLIRSLFGFGTSPDEWAGYRERVVLNAGWHFSYLGGPDAIRHKLASFSHDDLNTDRTRRASHLRRCLSMGVHFTGRYVLRYVPKEEFPPALVRLLDRFPTHFWFPPNHSNRVAAHAYCGYTWLRHRLPESFVGRADGHPLLASSVGLPVDAALRARRRAVNRPTWTWKNPIWIDWSPQPPPRWVPDPRSVTRPWLSRATAG